MEAAEAAATGLLPLSKVDTVSSSNTVAVQLEDMARLLRNRAAMVPHLPVSKEDTALLLPANKQVMELLLDSRRVGTAANSSPRTVALLDKATGDHKHSTPPLDLLPVLTLNFGNGSSLWTETALARSTHKS